MTIIDPANEADIIIIIDQANMQGLVLCTDEAREWAADNVDAEAWQNMGLELGYEGSVWVEARCIHPIVDAATAAGLCVKWN